MKYSINERPRDDGLVPLGIVVKNAGTVTIAATRLDRTALLVDKLQNKETDLATSAYTFTCTAGTFNDRFFVKLPVSGSGLLGDANNDGKVNVADIVAIVNYLEKGITDGFLDAQADADKDGSVAKADIEAVANIIIYGSPE